METREAKAEMGGLCEECRIEERLDAEDKSRQMRVGWKRLSDEALTKLRAAPHP